MNYRVSFFYTNHHKTIVTLDAIQLFHLDKALSEGSPSFKVTGFGKEGNSLYINLDRVRFTVAQSSEGALSELPGLPEYDSDKEADTLMGLS